VHGKRKFKDERRRQIDGESSYIAVSFRLQFNKWSKICMANYWIYYSNQLLIT